MARYRITGPDGGTFEVNAPDDATQDQVMAYVQQNAGRSEGAAKFAQPAMATANGAPKPVPAGEMIADVAKSAGIGVAQGAIGMATLPGNIEGLARAGINAGAGLVGVKPPVDSDTFLTNYNDAKKRVEGVTGEFYQPQTTAGKYVRTVGEFAGGAGAAGMIGKGVRAVSGAAPSAFTPTAAGIAVPAVASEAAGQLTEGTSLEPWARVAGAIAGTKAPNAGARFITPAPADPARANAIATLEREGVNALTAGQRTGDKLTRWVEDATAMVPGGGRVASKMQDQAARQFTRAALKRAGVNAELATADVLDTAFKSIGREYETFARSLPPTAPNPSIAARFGRIADKYDQNSEVGLRVPAVRKAAEDLAQRVANGGMGGQEFGALRSRLALAQRESKANTQASSAYREMMESLDAFVVRSAPRAARTKMVADLKDRNTRYRNLLAIEKAAVGAGDAWAGVISPALLRNAVKGQNVRSYATGRHPMADLARSGDGVLRPLPSSGTGERTYAQGIVGTPAAGVSAAIGGVATADPMVAALSALAPWAAKAGTARGIMSRPMQKYLGNQRIPRTIDPLDPRLPGLLAPFMLGRDDLK